MKKIKYILSTVFLLAFAQAGAQQTWQWGHRGGAALNTINPNPVEDMVDMATDANGNIYILALVKADAPPTLSGYAGTISNYGADDILLASYDCQGNYRWHKSLGGYAADMPLSRGGLGVDTLGGVYVAAMAPSPGAGSVSNAVHIDTDSIIAKGTTKSVFLVKYDTTGTFKWLRMPEPDTTSAMQSNSFFNSLCISENGEAYLNIRSRGGAMSDNGIVLPGQGDYILKYSSSGQLTAYVKLGMQSSMNPPTQFNAKLARDPNSGNFYLAGSYSQSGPMSMGGNPIINSAVIGAFNAQGQYLWHKTNNYQHAVGFYGYPQLDNQGNITLAGTLKAGGTLNDAFNGYTVSNPLSNVTRDCPFIVKMSPSGQNIWAANARATNSNVTAALVQTSSEVIIGGAASGVVTWAGGTDSLNFTSSGNRPFIAKFNATSGTPISMTHLEITNGSQYNGVTSLAADKNNNIYVGGTFGNQITVNSQTLTKAGGNTDFFIAKYGVDCDCIIPVANYTHLNGGGTTVNFTYTGTTPYTSISWDFGNGTTPATTANPSHTYATSGTYTVCVTVTNDCGSHTYCNPVEAGGTAIENIPGLIGIKIYPNPAVHSITIEQATPGTTMELYSATGQRLLLKTIHNPKEQIDIHNLPQGIYLIRLTTKEGHQGATRFIKQ